MNDFSSTLFPALSPTRRGNRYGELLAVPRQQHGAKRSDSDRFASGDRSAGTDQSGADPLPRRVPAATWIWRPLLTRSRTRPCWVKPARCVMLPAQSMPSTRCMRNTNAARFWILGMFVALAGLPAAAKPATAQPVEAQPAGQVAGQAPAGAQATAAHRLHPRHPTPESETCAACHEDIAKAFAKNPHHIVDTDKKRGFEGRACESCHGPGEAHAESADADQDPQSGEAGSRGGRPALSHLSFEYADARGALGKQPRQGPGGLHHLPQDACERRSRSGAYARRQRSTSNARAATSACGRSSRDPIIIRFPKAR